MNAHPILIALGANLPSSAGSPSETLRAALVELGSRHIRTERVSRFYGSRAWPDESDPPYVNAVASARTALSPRELLAQLHQVETAFGRTRSVRNAPRTLDLDLIDYERRIEPGPPSLPHPRMSGRGFVLLPLSEVAPDWLHPISRKTVHELIDELPLDAIDGVRPLR